MICEAKNDSLRYQQVVLKDRVEMCIRDSPWIMAGQGTAGLEIVEDMPDVDAVLVPCGGCGLISGVATALKESLKGVKVFGVEPEGSNSTYLSLSLIHI